MTVWLAAGLALMIGGLGPALYLGARGGYLGQALRGVPGHTPPPLPGVAWTGSGLLLGAASTVLALVVAGVGLYTRPGGLRRLTPALGVLRRLHSGHVGDYVAWLFAGAAGLAALIGLPLLH